MTAVMSSCRCKLPAFGRDLREALRRGLRPAFDGGGVIVTTSWGFARPFTRLVCDPGEPAATWDFSMLVGLEVLVLVPLRDEMLGEQLRNRIADAGASLSVLLVHRRAE